MKTVCVLIGILMIIVLVMPVSADGENVTATTGNITITSNPAGAAIYRDNANQNLFTPNTLSNVPNGTYVIALNLSGYQPWTQSVTVAGTDQSINSTLVALVTATTGNITITSNPAGAAIYRDNENQNLITPNTLSNVPNGTYVIALNLYGYHPWTQSVTVAGNDQSINSTLVALVTATPTTNVTTNTTTATPTTNVTTTTTTVAPVVNGSIAFTSSPANANVYINDVLKGYTPITVYNITPDSYAVKIQKVGYLIYANRFNVTSGNTTTVSATLTVEPTGTPTLAATAPITTAVTATPTIKSTAKTYTPWPTNTPTQQSPVPFEICIGAIGVGLVLLKKRG